MAEKLVLFVCTGNTCRSPMAQGIAESFIRKHHPDRVGVVVGSAGVAAGDGSPASIHAVEAMKNMGVDISGHQSQALTKAMVEDADVIYTMTPSHAQTIVDHLPESAHKVFPLDSNHPISDPFGGPIEVYCEVADQLTALIQSKIEEIVQ